MRQSARPLFPPVQTLIPPPAPHRDTGYKLISSIPRIPLSSPAGTHPSTRMMGKPPLMRQSAHPLFPPVHPPQTLIPPPALPLRNSSYDALKKYTVQSSPISNPSSQQEGKRCVQKAPVFSPTETNPLPSINNPRQKQRCLQTQHSNLKENKTRPDLIPSFRTEAPSDLQKTQMTDRINKLKTEMKKTIEMKETQKEGNLEETK